MSGPVVYTVDIETRPNEVYSWGLFDQNISVNQIINPGGVMMFAAKQYGDKKIEAHCEWDGHSEMVARAWEIFDDADYIVSYNGANFDTKHLKAAWVQAGLTPPSPWREIDLLRTVRKLNLPSRKLSYVTSALGLDHKTDPGGFETWVQILRGEGSVQTQARNRMVKYCKNDVMITEQLFERLRPWVDGLNLPLYEGEENREACTRCNSTDLHRRGWAYTTTYRYRRYRCNGCGGWLRSKRSEKLLNTELRNA